ncbi:cytochrome c1 [Mariprofundus erugo]|uniref:cytochrome c1 n=1 Tax=Mariprofundus erugo TaxID=2528639 RepID=UPI001EE820D2|nr:cytochrome c1 [Mariprofundus erugo]
MRSTRVLMVTAALLTAFACVALQQNTAITIASAAQQAGETMKLLKPAKLHSEAAISSPVTEIVWKDAVCQQLDQQPPWVQVRMALDGHIGWIHQKYLIAATPETALPASTQADSPPAPAEITSMTTPDGPQLQLSKAAKLHESAAGSSPVLEILEKDQVCTRLGQTDVWVHVWINSSGQRGWIHQLYLRPATPATENTPPTVADASTTSATAPQPAANTPSPPPATTAPATENRSSSAEQTASATDAASTTSATDAKPIENETSQPPATLPPPAPTSPAPAGQNTPDTGKPASPDAITDHTLNQPAASEKSAVTQKPAQPAEVKPKAAPSPAGGSHGDTHEQALSHASIDVTDRAQIRRGLTVFTDICMGCHSAKYLTWRGLIEYPEIGLSSEEVAELRGNNPVMRGMISDLPPEDAIAAYGKAPPDLSLIVAGRRGGADYVYSLLTGYAHDPAKRIADPAYNPVYPGHRIAMPDPLSWLDHSMDEEASLRRQAEDVAAFLTFIADPHQNTRRHIGVWVVSFLLILTFVLWLLKVEVWKDVKPSSPKRGWLASLRPLSGEKQERP